MTLLLNNEEIAQLISMRECIDVLRDGYREHGLGRVAHRRRSNIVVPTGEGRTYVFANFEGTVIKHGYHAIRLRSDVNVWRDKAGDRAIKYASRPGLYCGLVLLYNIQTGELDGILNDGYLQLMRVSATSALAASYLSREDSRVLGMVGAGSQARSHVEAMCAIRPIEKVKVYSLRRERRESFARETAAKLGVGVTAVGSPQAAFEECDIVCTCTDSPRPFVKSEWIGAGMHMSSVRPFGEVGLPVVSKERGDGPRAVGGKDERDLPSGMTLAELCAGHGAGRTNPLQRTYFANNEGHGVQFSAAGAFVLKRARELGIGRDLPTRWFLQDITT
ncbi:MAG: ornithine cyclodeaminase family protein [Candidatus Tectomicrobia bacterium]|uniref:Ornithine cyclodeaminase family protein n=1 Tax=Tectimicrobiota bacterium TaxID=2528274 RepID=A0A932GN47_UNCTE|nr:ornithine cyclodeaminase family protein [Candidatus Tectomicrobia bacterium]